MEFDRCPAGLDDASDFCAELGRQHGLGAPAVAACPAAVADLVAAGRDILPDSCDAVEAAPARLAACYGLGIDCDLDADGAPVAFRSARALGGVVYTVAVKSCDDARALDASFCADLARLPGGAPSDPGACAAFLADLRRRAAAILPGTCHPPADRPEPTES